MIVNIPRPETLEEAKAIIDYYESHKEVMKVSNFYLLMKTHYERGVVIRGHGYLFEFFFEKMDDALEFKQKFIPIKYAESLIYKIYS